MLPRDADAGVTVPGVTAPALTASGVTPDVRIGSRRSSRRCQEFRNVGEREGQSSTEDGAEIDRKVPSENAETVQRGGAVPGNSIWVLAALCILCATGATSARSHVFDDAFFDALVNRLQRCSASKNLSSDPQPLVEGDEDPPDILDRSVDPSSDDLNLPPTEMPDFDVGSLDAPANLRPLIVAVIRVREETRRLRRLSAEAKREIKSLRRFVCRLADALCRAEGGEACLECPWRETATKFDSTWPATTKPTFSTAGYETTDSPTTPSPPTTLFSRPSPDPSARCPEPDPPDHGSIVEAADGVGIMDGDYASALGAVVSVACDDGYVLVGVPTMECAALWSERKGWVYHWAPPMSAVCKSVGSSGAEGKGRGRYLSRSKKRIRRGIRRRKGACLMPRKVGPCKALIRRYFFNVDYGKCEPFYFGGCRGNANNFSSMERCIAKCVKTKGKN